MRSAEVEGVAQAVAEAFERERRRRSREQRPAIAALRQQAQAAQDARRSRRPALVARAEQTLALRTRARLGSGVLPRRGAASSCAKSTSEAVAEVAAINARLPRSRGAPAALAVDGDGGSCCAAPMAANSSPSSPPAPTAVGSRCAVAVCAATKATPATRAMGDEGPVVSSMNGRA